MGSWAVFEWASADVMCITVITESGVVSVAYRLMGRSAAMCWLNNSSWSHRLRGRSPDGPHRPWGGTSVLPDVVIPQHGNSHILACSVLFGLLFTCSDLKNICTFPFVLYLPLQTAVLMPLSCIPVESGVTSDTSLWCVTFTETCFGLRSPKNNYRATSPMFQEPSNRKFTSLQWR